MSQTDLFGPVWQLRQNSLYSFHFLLPLLFFCSSSLRSTRPTKALFGFFSSWSVSLPTSTQAGKTRKRRSKSEDAPVGSLHEPIRAGHCCGSHSLVLLFSSYQLFTRWPAKEEAGKPFALLPKEWRCERHLQHSRTQCNSCLREPARMIDIYVNVCACH